MDGLFFKRHLQEALKEAKLPWSYKAILKFERDGIIPLPERIDGRERYYTQEQIDLIVKKVLAYKSK